MTGFELPDQLIESIRSAHHIAITTHIRPDGDAAGSTIGLASLLNQAGIQASIVGMDTVVDMLTDVLPPFEVMAPGKPDEFDLFIVLDASDLQRTPEFAARWAQDIKTINIDHHPTNEAFGAINWIVPEAAAVAEMIVYLAQAMELSFNQDAATALWVGLITDTGRFAFSNTTEQTLRAASVLLQHPIDTSGIDKRIFHVCSLSALRLQGLAMTRLHLFNQDRFAIIGISQEDFTQCEASTADTESIVNIPQRLAGNQLAVLCYEMLDDDGHVVTKVSMRSSPPYDVAEFCKCFDGGGHARAAGCTIPSQLPEAQALIVEAIRQNWETQS